MFFPSLNLVRELLVRAKRDAHVKHDCIFYFFKNWRFWNHYQILPWEIYIHKLLINLINKWNNLAYLFKAPPIWHCRNHLCELFLLTLQYSVDVLWWHLEAAEQGTTDHISKDFPVYLSRFSINKQSQAVASHPQFWVLVKKTLCYRKDRSNW